MKRTNQEVRAPFQAVNQRLVRVFGWRTVSRVCWDMDWMVAQVARPLEQPVKDITRGFR